MWNLFVLFWEVVQRLLLFVWPTELIVESSLEVYPAVIIVADDFH
ncbi:hypothetical protein OENI_40134 [Oenococcus oeni]|nr:hypothetical protein OENI_40134 [Oenococcus oeni]SYW09181.1 hypothetical protein OENI_60069 [Oenococcus oeni]